jgi:hypothetical protein
MRLYAISEGGRLAAALPGWLPYPAAARVMVASHEGDADGIAFVLPEAALLVGRPEAAHALIIHGQLPETVVTVEPLTGKEPSTVHHVMQVVPGSLARGAAAAERAGPFSGDAFTRAALGEQSTGLTAYRADAHALLRNVWVGDISTVFEEGVSRVTLLVEQSDGPAVRRAKKLGFKTVSGLYSYRLTHV